MQKQYNTIFAATNIKYIFKAISALNLVMLSFLKHPGNTCGKAQ